MRFRHIDKKIVGIAGGWAAYCVRDEFQRLQQRNAALKSDLGNAEQRVRDMGRQVGSLLSATAHMDNQMNILREAGISF